MGRWLVLSRAVRHTGGMKLPSPAPSAPGEVHHSASSVPVDGVEAVFPALRQRALVHGWHVSESGYSEARGTIGRRGDGRLAR